MKKALEHLENAETILLSWIRDLSVAVEGETEGPDPMPIILALQRSIGHAAGCLEEALSGSV